MSGNLFFSNSLFLFLRIVYNYLRHLKYFLWNLVINILKFQKLPKESKWDNIIVIEWDTRHSFCTSQDFFPGTHLIKTFLRVSGGKILFRQLNLEENPNRGIKTWCVYVINVCLKIFEYHFCDTRFIGRSLYIDPDIFYG